MQHRIRRHRGPCETEGCVKQRWKQGLCQKHAREAGLTGPAALPVCAVDGCNRQAQSVVEGSLCRPCRKDASCATEGCPKPPRGGGYCRPCRHRREREAGKTCLTESCDNRAFRGEGGNWCEKHAYQPDACVRAKCSRPATKDGLCRIHLEALSRGCTAEGCVSPRYQARLCYRHYREAFSAECAHPACRNRVTGTYCGTHDVGIDFAAGDWFDWVAAERLFHGRLDDRKPTIPELSAALRMADKRHVPRNEIGRRLGLDERMWGIWCNQVRSLDAA